MFAGRPAPLPDEESQGPAQHALFVDAIQPAQNTLPVLVHFPHESLHLELICWALVIAGIRIRSAVRSGFERSRPGLKRPAFALIAFEESEVGHHFVSDELLISWTIPSQFVYCTPGT